MIFWDLGKKQEPRHARKKQEQTATAINEDNDVKNNLEEAQKNSDKCTKHGNPDRDNYYDSDESEEEVPCTIYNCAEARLLFRLETVGMEEEQEEEESED
jgi:hypothetical protein